MATLTPDFRQFVPPWVARQPWYTGHSTSELRPVGFLRFEDPEGEVGIETHVLRDENTVYQVPMTYRGAPLPGADEALIRVGGSSDPSTTWDGIGPVSAHGRLLQRVDFDDELAVIELRRVLIGQDPDDFARDAGEDVVGLLHGTWHTSAEAAPVTGVLAVVRAPTANPSR